MSQLKSPSTIGNWEQRRKFMWYNTIFDMWVICMILLTKQDTQVAQIVASGCLWSLMATLLFYVFGATVQDVMALRTGFKQSTVQVTENAGVAPDQPEVSSLGTSSTVVTSSAVSTKKNLGPKQPVRGGKARNR